MIHEAFASRSILEFIQRCLLFIPLAEAFLCSFRAGGETQLTR